MWTIGYSGIITHLDIIRTVLLSSVYIIWESRVFAIRVHDFGIHSNITNPTPRRSIAEPKLLTYMHSRKRAVIIPYDRCLCSDRAFRFIQIQVWATGLSSKYDLASKTLDVVADQALCHHTDLLLVLGKQKEVLEISKFNRFLLERPRCVLQTIIHERRTRRLPRVPCTESSNAG
jgi:hypothetical protein